MGVVWIIAFWVLLALGAVLVLRGWFWDRPGWRGRPARRCKRCWYDLGGAGDVPVKCSECGNVHTRERWLRRVRRHKRVVAVGVVMLLGAPVAGLVPAYQQNRLLVRVPSWVLVKAMPWMPGSARTISADTNLPCNELAFRIAGYQGRALAHEDVVSVMNWVCDGGIGVTPGSERWAKTMGSWLYTQKFRFRSKAREWQYPDGVPADGALLEVIDRISNIAPAWQPGTREAWPEGAVVTIWSGNMISKYERWQYEDTNLENATFILHGHQAEPEEINIKWFGGYFQLKARGKSGDHLHGELTLRYFRVPEDWDYDALPDPLNTEKFEIGWDVVGDISDAVDLVDSDEIRTALVAGTVSRLVDEAAITDFGSDWLAPPFDGIGFAVIVQVFDGDERLAQVTPKWMARGGEWALRSPSLGDMTTEQYRQYPQRVQDAIAKGSLRFKIVGDPELALEIRDARRAWDGTIEIGYEQAAETARVYFDENK